MRTNALLVLPAVLATTAVADVRDLAPCFDHMQEPQSYVDAFVAQNWTHVIEGDAYQRALHGAGQAMTTLNFLQGPFDTPEDADRFLARAYSDAEMRADWTRILVREDQSIAIQFIPDPLDVNSIDSVACLLIAPSFPTYAEALRVEGAQRAEQIGITMTTTDLPSGFDVSDVDNQTAFIFRPAYHPEASFPNLAPEVIMLSTSPGDPN